MGCQDGKLILQSQVGRNRANGVVLGACVAWKGRAELIDVGYAKMVTTIVSKAALQVFAAC